MAAKINPTQTLRGKPIKTGKRGINVKFVCPGCGGEMIGKSYNRYWHECKKGVAPFEMHPAWVIKIADRATGAIAKMYEQERWERIKPKE